MATSVPIYGIASPKPEVQAPCPGPSAKSLRLQSYMALYIEILQQLRSTMDDQRAADRLELLKTKIREVNNL
jgi:hypothetical protein